MKNISISIKGLDLDFESSQTIAKAIATMGSPDTTSMAWYDKKLNRHSPATVECNSKGTPGWEEYGRNHDGKWEISINEGDYVFIYT